MEITLFWIGFAIGLCVIPIAWAEVNVIKNGGVKGKKDMFVHFAFLGTMACALTTSPAVLIGSSILVFTNPTWFQVGFISNGIIWSALAIYMAIWPFEVMFRYSELNVLRRRKEQLETELSS